MFQVEGSADIILSSDSYFAMMADGGDTGGIRSALLVVKVYKYSTLENAMTTCIRDASKSYGSTSRVNRAFWDKLNKVLQYREIWYCYPAMEEDEKLQDTKWNEWYAGLQTVMWDNTNLDMKSKSSDAEIFSDTHPSYYNDNVGKGSVYLQLCICLGAHKIWMGAVSDTE